MPPPAALSLLDRMADALRRAVAPNTTVAWEQLTAEAKGIYRIAALATAKVLLNEPATEEMLVATLPLVREAPTDDDRRLAARAVSRLFVFGPSARAEQQGATAACDLIRDYRTMAAERGRELGIAA